MPVNQNPRVHYSLGGYTTERAEHNNALFVAAPETARLLRNNGRAIAGKHCSVLPLVRKEVNWRIGR